MNKEIYVVVGILLALSLFFVGFIGPWYTIQGEFFGVEASIDISFFETKLNAGSALGSFSMDIDRGATDTTMYIALLTILCTIISCIGVIGSIYPFGKSLLMQKIGELFGGITVVVAIVTMIYYWTHLPDISNLEPYGVDGEIGWGFFLFLIAAVVLFSGIVYSRMTRE